MISPLKKKHLHLKNGMRWDSPLLNVSRATKKLAFTKQAEVANQETKEDLPAENGEAKNEESPASDEAGEKEAKSD